MILIIGVRFRKSGKVYYFAPNGLDIKKGDHVIVETARGIEYGLVVLGQKEVTDDKVVQPLKDVIRIATESDYEIHAENEEKEKEAYKICLEKIAKHELQMKLIDCEYTFDKNKASILLYGRWQNRFQRTCKRPCFYFQNKNRTSSELWS